MPSRPCLTCGALTRSGSYCARHTPKRNSRQTPGRGSGRTFREAVLAAAGYRCQAIEQGRRCPVTDPRRLEAHHVVAIVAGGRDDPATNGVCLCRRHHRLAERNTRGAARNSRRSTR